MISILTKNGDAFSTKNPQSLFLIRDGEDKSYADLLNLNPSNLLIFCKLVSSYTITFKNSEKINEYMIDINNCIIKFITDIINRNNQLQLNPNIIFEESLSPEIPPEEQGKSVKGPGQEVKGQGKQAQAVNGQRQAHRQRKEATGYGQAHRQRKEATGYGQAHRQRKEATGYGQAPRQRKEATGYGQAPRQTKEAIGQGHRQKQVKASTGQGQGHEQGRGQKQGNGQGQEENEKLKQPNNDMYKLICILKNIKRAICKLITCPY